MSISTRLKTVSMKQFSSFRTQNRTNCSTQTHSPSVLIMSTLLCPLSLENRALNKEKLQVCAY